jgi:nitrogen fixation/metabolism regulation signal transduction histidine kinase
MDSALNIYFRTEELEQVLFQVFNNAIQSLENKTDATNRKLTINGIRLGSSIVLDVINSGTSQAKSVVDNEVSEIDDANIGLTICESFMEEFGGKVQFDVMTNSKGERSGEIVKLVFKGLPSQQTARLVDVKVGTKKEILDQISI